MKKEYIGYMLAILSVIASGFFSWYFYSQSQQSRKPYYATDIIPSTVYKASSKNNLPFKVISNSGKPIKDNIYLAKHYFWNKGKRPILTTDVLEPLTIKILNTDSIILNVSIEKMSRYVVNCKIVNMKNDKKTFSISYKVLEKDDGCLINLVYTGKKNPEIEIEGVIVGVNEIILFDDTIDKIIENIHWYNSILDYIPFVIPLLAYSLFLILFLFKIGMSFKDIVIKGTVFILVVIQVTFIVDTKIRNSKYSFANNRPYDVDWVTEKSNPNKKLNKDAAKTAAPVN